MTTALHEILYCSQLAPEQAPSIVGQIVSFARARNAAKGITGLLVFDGLRFCQHFEGDRDVVVRLMSKLDSDPRHTQIKVLYEGPIFERRYPRFDMGLAPLDDSDDIAIVERLDGQPALDHFLSLRPRFDIAG